MNEESKEELRIFEYNRESSKEVIRLEDGLEIEASQLVSDRYGFKGWMCYSDNRDFNPSFSTNGCSKYI